MADLSDMEAIATDLAEIQCGAECLRMMERDFKRCQSELYAENDNLLEMLVERTTERGKMAPYNWPILVESIFATGHDDSGYQKRPPAECDNPAHGRHVAVDGVQRGFVRDPNRSPELDQAILDQAWSVLSR